MPKFKKNTSPAMYKKPSSFKMNGFSGFGNSPMHQNWLDTKLTNIPKKVKNTVSNTVNTVKNKFKNTTVRDVLNLSPTFNTVNKIIKKRKTKTDMTDAAKNALRNITSHSLMSTKYKKTLKRKTNTTVNTVKKLPVQKMPVADNTRLVTTPKKYNIPKKKRS